MNRWPSGHHNPPQLALGFSSMNTLTAINTVLDAAGYAPVASATTANRAADVARNALDAQRLMLLSTRPAFAHVQRTLYPDAEGNVPYPPDAVSLDVIDCVPCRILRPNITTVDGNPLGRQIRVALWLNLTLDEMPQYAASLIAFRAAHAQVATATDPLRVAATARNLAMAESAYAAAYLREFRVVLSMGQMHSRHLDNVRNCGAYPWMR